MTFGKLGFLGILLLIATSLGAADIQVKMPSLKVGDDTYNDVTVTSVTATDIYFSHKLGMGNAKLKNLSPELQKQFGYDPEKANAKAQELANGYAEYVKAAREEKPVKRVNATDNESEDIPEHEVFARSFLGQVVQPLVVEKWLQNPGSSEGKFTLLVFWATWSAPSKNSIASLNRFATKFKDHLVVIGLTDETEEAVIRFTEPRIEYASAIDSQQRALKYFGVLRIPHAVLVDPKGVVRFEGNPGYLNERSLEKLLNTDFSAR
jgi:thiol-disulfide isomerase/thioredoxin